MKVALVTGAAGDIGRAICAALLADGMAVAGLDINEPALQAAREQLAAGERFLPVVVDITRLDSVTAAVRRANEALGDVEVLVNNAGAITQSSLRATEESDWLRDIDLNLNGPWRCIRALQEQFIRNRSGVIVNIASVNGLGIYGHPGYSAAKAGLIHLTRFCAVEFGKHGVRSVVICPGSVKTQLWQERQRAQPEIFAEIASWYPSREVCEPADVAKAVAFVASDQAALMNGAVIALDGGLVAGSDRFASMFTGGAL